MAPSSCATLACSSPFQLIAIDTSPPLCEVQEALDLSAWAQTTLSAALADVEVALAATFAETEPSSLVLH